MLEQILKAELNNIAVLIDVSTIIAAANDKDALKESSGAWPRVLRKWPAAAQQHFRC